MSADTVGHVMAEHILGRGSTMSWIGIEAGPSDRMHMLVWRSPHVVRGDLNWRVSWAMNGIPIGYGSPFGTWEEAFDYAYWEARAAR